MTPLPAPFHADAVGSYLRPAALHEARTDFAEGRTYADQLRHAEDREIRALIAAQEAAGLHAVTDGEFRRAWWHFDFFGMLDGVEVVELDHGIQFQGVQTRPLGLRVTGPIGFPDDHPMLEHFRFLVANASPESLPKMTIPAPTVLDFRLEPDAIVTDAYDGRAAIVDDLAGAYRAAVAAFYAAGCRYLQFDDTAWAYLCSPVELEKARQRGMETDGIAQRYASVINASLAGRPDDMAITTHVCRGNFRSTWISSGGYEPVAEQLLSVCDYDGYFLEYDTDRAGGFEPLRFLPHGNKRVVLGLITSKSGELEKPADVRARIDEAAAFAPLDQLALSPQCGFASTEEGNTLTEDQQWAKMRSVVAIADEVWH